MRVLIAEVIEADIKTGEPMTVDDAHPVALAVRRALGWPAGFGYIRVGSSSFSMGTGGFYESHLLPGGSPEWIARFDSGAAVEPFSFTFTTRWGDEEDPASR